MQYSIIITEPAADDLDQIITFISLDSVLNEIRAAFESLSALPESGRIVPEFLLNNISSYREVIVSEWRVIYRIGSDSVYILAVLDSRREISELLNKRLLM